MTIRIEARDAGFDKAGRVLGKLSHIDMRGLLDNVGQMIENQVKGRLDQEKKTPEGEDWEPWSDAYEKTRHSGHSLLVSEGHLLDSIQHVVSGDEVEIGSNLIYAATHQLGDHHREYLGLSDENKGDIKGLVEEFIERLTR